MDVYDVYNKFNLKHVINADGKMTILGVSKVKDDVVNAQKIGAQNFFEMSELVCQTGSYIAKLVGSEDAVIVNSASAGIAQSIAGIIGQGDLYHVYHPYTERITKREIILPLGHDVNYGTPVDVMLGIAGAAVIYAGYANMCHQEHIETQITKNTAAILYIKSHHTVQKSMLTIQEALEIAHKHSLPLILDAAAEDDLTKYIKMGVDVVIYSGAKALEGPTSGIVFGKKKYVEWTRLQAKGIGRAMKIGKENIIGLSRAIELYMKNGPETGLAIKKRLKPLVRELSKHQDLEVSIVKDGAGRDIYRASIKVLKNCLLSAREICEDLRNGTTAIYTREYRVNEGFIEIDVRAVNENEIQQIVSRFNEILSKK